MFPVVTNFPFKQGKLEGTITEGHILNRIEQKIDELQLLKLNLLNTLPMAHSVWGDRNNPMSWKLVSRVADGVVFYKGFLSGMTYRKTYAEWNTMLLRDKYVDITKEMRR